DVGDRGKLRHREASLLAVLPYLRADRVLERSDDDIRRPGARGELRRDLGPRSGFLACLRFAHARYRPVKGLSARSGTRVLTPITDARRQRPIKRFGCTRTPWNIHARGGKSTAMREDRVSL